MIADIYKVGPLKYPKIFQCDNSSEFKGDMTKMLEKQEVKIRRVTRLGCKMEFYTLNYIMSGQDLYRGQCYDNDLLP